MRINRRENRTRRLNVAGGSFLNTGGNRFESLQHERGTSSGVDHFEAVLKAV